MEVESRPAILDLMCESYRNKFSKGKTWEELCDIFVRDFKDMDVAARNKAGTYYYVHCIHCNML